MFKSGACVGDDASGSEETMIIGGLWSLGMVKKGAVEKADSLFRVGLRWVGEGTSSVSRRCRSTPPVEPIDDEAGLDSSNELRSCGGCGE